MKNPALPGFCTMALLLVSTPAPAGTPQNPRRFFSDDSFWNQPIAPNAEVDELVWLPMERVRSHLTWERDQELFDLVGQLPELRAHAS